VYEEGVRGREVEGVLQVEVEVLESVKYGRMKKFKEG
jgi:hypothetical protein